MGCILFFLGGGGPVQVRGRVGLVMPGFYLRLEYYSTTTNTITASLAVVTVSTNMGQFHGKYQALLAATVAASGEFISKGRAPRPRCELGPKSSAKGFGQGP